MCYNYNHTVSAAFKYRKEVIGMQKALKDLDVAYKNFFVRPESGFPKFKSKHDGHSSYRTSYNMVRNYKLAQAISDVAWFEFVSARVDLSAVRSCP